MSAPAHALLSASGAHRWLNCTPSARLEETLPDEGSAYAAEGTLAHAVGELKLTKHFTPMGPRKYSNALKKLKADPLWQDEMDKHTDTYLEIVQSIAHTYTSPPTVGIERRLDFGEWAPEGFGTGDCIVIGGDTLHVIDFKYGKGVPVSAEDNPQMRLYALGAWQLYSMVYDIKRIKMLIIQPRLLDEPSEAEMTIEELLAWGECVKPIAQKAHLGLGDYVPGDHCRFCKAKATCRARADANLELAKHEFAKPPLLTNAEVGVILVQAQQLAKWAADLQDYSLSELLAGRDVPGWKAVEGRSNRQFADTDKAFDLVKAAGIAEALLYKRQPITLTEVEKILGKKQFAEVLADQIIKPPGKPALAPESDTREAITNRSTAAQDFSD